MGQTIKVKKHDRGIGDYLERLREWEEYPARITNGEMLIKVGETWYSKNIFDNTFKKPFVMDFLGDATNPDGTKNWMNK